MIAQIMKVVWTAISNFLLANPPYEDTGVPVGCFE
jgi:hypothetical protein